jgi:hypothetical protein
MQMTSASISEPGIYADVSEADYHADPCPEPSLSRTVLKKLVDLTPAHAFVAHPKLGGSPIGEDDDGAEVARAGTAAHSSFLQGKSLIERLDFKDWRTKASKEARHEAIQNGLIPLLTKGYDHAMRLVEVLEDFRNRTGAFTHGLAEQTVVWTEGPIWCRCRVDWLPVEPSASPWDLKTTTSTAAMAAWQRAAFDKACDLQDAFYCRGLEMVREEPPDSMLFCVVEQRPPYAVAVYRMSPIARDIADQKVRAGISLWENCLATGQWPGFPIEPQWISPPAWIIRDWEERGALSARSIEIAREIRELPLGVQMVRTDDFGG